MPSGYHNPAGPPPTLDYPVAPESDNNTAPLSLREIFLLVGAAAGIIAFIGMILLWFTTRSALASMAEQSVAAITAVPGANPNTAITVAFNPFAGLGVVFGMGGMFALMFITIVGLILYIVRMNRTNS